MRFDIITIFPNIFDSYFAESIIKRAREKKLIDIKIHDLRDYTEDRHRKVDDRPYGGGAGMVLMVEPIFKAVSAVKKKSGNSKVILLSAKGKKFNQATARKYSDLNQLIIICGRYEGVDERVAENIVDEEISVGDYILTGGELPAMVVVDSVSRLIGGVISEESLEEESFSKEKTVEYPQYTRPEEFHGWKVPDVLVSGNHKEIERWKKEHSGGKK